MTVDFNDYFWGEKNNGYDVLYHNMKFGFVASKELSDFFREKTNVEEQNSKLMTKLAHKAGSGTLNGTFAPIWGILKSSAERLSNLHLQMVQKLSELVKDISKYADELHKKHKLVKDEESSTLEAVQAMQSSTQAVQKSKDLYTNKMQELEKLRKENGTSKDIEKVETKLKKLQDDYKNLMDKHAPIKLEFENKMTATCRRFQEIEEAHLRQMREFLSTYLELVQTNHDMVGQVHSEFKRQFLDMSVDKLLEQFVLNKYTGLEKPEKGQQQNEQQQQTSKVSSQLHQQHQQQQQSTQHQQQTSSPQVQQPIQQTKSSRRTTSLLNLFMSNSQGSRESREQVEALSAPTSPNEQGLSNQNISQIGRNPLLRGSKYNLVSGILRSRRDKAKTKKSKKKKDTETSSNKDENIIIDEKSDQKNNENSPVQTPATTTANVNFTNSNTATSGIAPTATPEVDEDGYSIKPRNKETSWNDEREKGNFYSSSDSDSDNDKPERKIHVEIKPLNNGTAPISASVDELRATVGNISLSPIGVLSNRGGSTSDNHEMKRSQSVSQKLGEKPSIDLLGLTLFHQQHSQHLQSTHSNNSYQQQSPGASNASTPTTVHPYAPLQSPTLSVSNNSRYADLGDIFSTEIGEISASAPASATLSKASSRQIPTPTSASSIAIPRPPSRRSEAAIRGRVSPSSMSRADSVGSMEFRTAVGIGSSRGPSPLTIGMTDTIPLAVAFHEIIHAYFRGSDESRCQVKMSGDMMLSFPAGIVSILANNPNPAKLGFRIKHTQNLENLIPNKQLVQIDKLQSTSFSTMLEFDMNALTALLRRQSEQNPNASYFNVDILKYMIKSKLGASSCPFQLVSYWKCEPTHTALKIDYKYNSHAMASPSSLLNLIISVPVDGDVKNVQSKPHSVWLGESNRLVWNFTDISQHSEGNGIGTLRARLEVRNGPSTPSTLTVQFNCEGTTLSGIEFELVGTGYRLSLVKRRFVAGKYICEGDGIRNITTPTPPTSVGSPYSAKSN
ncbi:F-BAR domain only protein 2 isoform X12 [Condylostylus longicornis]|uniref:F-BAR domain only protein 2 isoform X12 n=1 Tax=Condylostylus longicornis TaxID=2530218 RepID=UPI00244DAED1|nr:F-BAR domain only protein 2 isoform X12 [Condylostylus longicornis]